LAKQKQKKSLFGQTDRLDFGIAIGVELSCDLRGGGPVVTFELLPLRGDEIKKKIC